MDSENKVSFKGPYPIIDYRKILAKKKEREMLRPPTQKVNSIENKGFLVKVKNVWFLSDKKVKIEIIVFLISLLLSLVFLFFLVKNATQTTENKNPVEALPLEMLNR